MLGVFPNCSPSLIGWTGWLASSGDLSASASQVLQLQTYMTIPSFVLWVLGLQDNQMQIVLPVWLSPPSHLSRTGL